MESTVIVKQGQCLIDIALQTTGSAEAAFDLAAANGISITDKLAPGIQLKRIDVVDAAVVAYYKANNITPASGDITNL